MIEDPRSHPFDGRRALITGASGGIGGALAVVLARKGADLVLGYGSNQSDAEAVAQRASDCGRTVELIRADVADPSSVSELARAAQATGPVDILVPAAGIAPVAAWDAVTPELWEQTFRVNATAPFLLASRLLPGMVERAYGRILFVSSIAALNGGVIGPHYAASKSALHGLMHNLAASTAARGVTVNCLAPALIAGTRMLPIDPQSPSDLPARIPVGRLGTTREVADLRRRSSRTPTSPTRCSRSTEGFIRARS
jgi:3-oxoacyl-[acyl-carrier protein] reductase